MPDSPALVDAGNALLEMFQGLDPSASHLKLAHFEHGGALTRGLATTSDIHANNPVVVVPKHLLLNNDTMVEKRFHHIMDMSDDPLDRNTMALWLAEKKMTLHRKAWVEMTPIEKYWASVIKSLPSLREYRDMGIPLAAPEEDLGRLAMLPRFKGIARWSKHVHKMLHVAVDEFNHEKATVDPTIPAKIQYDDALWGRIVASTRTFNCASATLAPIADMINHSGDVDNVRFSCDLDTGALKMLAIKEVKAGDELKLAYHSAQGSAEDMVQFYGIYEGNRTGETWPAAECAQLQGAHLGQNGGAMLRTVSKLVDERCTAGNLTKSPASPAKNPHPDLLTKEAAANPLIAWLLPQTCLPAVRSEKRAVGSKGRNQKFPVSTSSFI
jgi:hypothetical protein